MLPAMQMDLGSVLAAHPSATCYRMGQHLLQLVVADGLQNAQQKSTETVIRLSHAGRWRAAAGELQ
jgi:hypothetical protein